MPSPESQFPGAVAGRYWHSLEDGRIQCDLCPRYCKLREGQRGLCFVRARENNRMILTTYGRSSGFCIDPIEKKPLNHFYPGSPVFSFGTAGCNLSCKFCQNWDISKSREMDRLQSRATPEMIAATASRMKCKSVAYTYNDPVIFLEYAVDTARACKEQGIKNVAVSAGYICPEPRQEFFQYMDAANIDLKAFTEEFYHKHCTAKLESVLDTLKYLKNETGVWIEITDLLIPDENDSPREIERMATWIVKHLGEDVPLHFTAFHPDYKMMDKPRTPPDTLLQAREVARQCGVRFVYTGNIFNKESGSTWCPSCNKLLIGRDWQELSEWHMQINDDHSGNCEHCGTPIPGFFDHHYDKWGRKRISVQFQ